MSARTLHAAGAREAVRAIDFIFGWSGGWMPVVRHREPRRRALWWHHAGVRGSARRLAESVIRCDELYSDECEFGLPQRRRWNDGIHVSTVLWVKVEGADQLKRARAFRPLPTLVIQEGSSSRRWLFWWLEKPVGYFDVEERNRKISYALRATQKHGHPDRAWFPMPGTCLRVGRSRPVPIVVSRLTVESYLPDQVTGRLKEPPAKDAWLEARS